MADKRILGEDSIFFVKYNNVWCPISCETSSPISESVEMMNTTTRDNGGWKTEKPTLQSYSISVEAVLTLDDELPDSGVVSYNKLRLMKRNHELVEWKRETFGGWYIDQGQAYITEISDSNAVGEDIMFSMSLSGFGAPKIGTETPMPYISSIVDINGNESAFSAINNAPAQETGYLKKISGYFPEAGSLVLFIAKNKGGAASPYTFTVGQKFTVNIPNTGLNTIDLNSLNIIIKKGEYLGVAKDSTAKPYYGTDAMSAGWYQTSEDIMVDSIINTPFVSDATFAIGFTAIYTAAMHSHKLTAVQNAENYNSIRNLIDSITDSSESNQYEIFVPNGTWNEVDWQGKVGVKIIGESRDGTIIKLDPQGTMATEIAPANYAFPTEAGKDLSDVNVNYMHIVYALDDIHCENLTFDTKNSKYAIHIDNPNLTKATFKNCRIKEEFSNYPIGMGIFGGQTILFDKCIIQPLTMWRGFFYHNWNNQTEPNNVTFNRCKFLNCNYAMIDELGSEQDDWVNITNCTSTLGAAGIDFMVDMNGSGDTFWINQATSLNEPNPVNVPYNIRINASGTLVGALTSADSGSFDVAWTGTPQRNISTIQSISINL